MIWRVYRINSSFDSFDTLQKLILNELENVFDDLADVMAKFNDIADKTCWTFQNEVCAQAKGSWDKPVMRI